MLGLVGMVTDKGGHTLFIWIQDVCLLLCVCVLDFSLCGSLPLRFEGLIFSCEHPHRLRSNQMTSPIRVIIHKILVFVIVL